MSAAELVVVGGGVVGLTTALAFKRRHPSARVVVLEKDHVGAHASGRNSGVLHAGFYYGADTLKARYSRDGSLRMAAWCEARGLPLLRCGKLVVARSAADHGQLEVLEARAAANGVRLERVDAAEARRIEPRVRTVGHALWSPDTASVDPCAVMDCLAADAREQGIELREGVCCQRVDDDGVVWEGGRIAAGRVLNAAGVFADRFAHGMGLARHLQILPFKGLYLVDRVGAPPLRTHVYPVPDLRMPFLGVHFTLTTSGRAKIGPTALPALGREHYVGMQGLEPAHAATLLHRELCMGVRDPSFRRLAWRELRKSSRAHLVRLASSLLDGVEEGDWRTWGRPGIRAQLVDTRTSRLVMDFLLARGRRSVHVLNAISPAFTCALPMADHLVDVLESPA